MTDKDREIIAFIKVIRESFHEAKIIYTWGACYNFYKILKQVYPEAAAYPTIDCKQWDDNGHIFTKIGDNYFDITGTIDSTTEKVREAELSEEEHVQWESNMAGLRAEEMITRALKFYRSKEY